MRAAKASKAALQLQLLQKGLSAHSFVLFGDIFTGTGNVFVGNVKAVLKIIK